MSLKSIKKSDEIFLALDPDREGEMIAWHLVEICKEKKIFDGNLTLITSKNSKNETEKIKKIKSFEGDPCDRCGNFTVYKEDKKIKCLTCLHKFDE